MDLATIDTSRDEAEAMLAEYRSQLEAERTVEDAAIAMACRAVVRGLTVIRLSECVQAGGFFPNGLPRIAVVRADATECHVSIDRWRSSGGRVGYVFAPDRDAENRGALVGERTVRVNVPEPALPDGARRAFGGRTTVPLIPPRHRPKANRLASRHILWEVEAWDPTPPVDPALIQHLRGDLWAVHAVWDLTELERAVLSGRRAAG